MLKSAKNFYIKFNPEVLDFTNPAFKAELQIFSPNHQISISFENDSNFVVIVGLLKDSIFGQGVVNLVWNIKNFYTYHKYITRIDFEPLCQLFDIKVIEGYQSVRNKAPEGYKEASKRMMNAYSAKGWFNVKKIYQKIHIPLITKVLPSIETTGVMDRGKRATVYPYYEIEGQVNGRMNCSEGYLHSFNPHGLSEEIKSNLFPKQLGDSFVVLDFHYYEVSVLQWLAQDEGLKRVIESGDDFYKTTFKLLSGGVCDTEAKRNLVKKAFLPVIYGMSVDSLSKALNIGFATADKIVSQERKLFSRSFEWVEDFQNQPGTIREDFLGRQRVFDESQSYLIRNFGVQSPAALVSLEKLIRLHEALKGYGKVICHIYDGYVVCTDRKSLGAVCTLAKEALESESELCPGLKLKCSCKVGPALNSIDYYDKLN